MRSIGVETCIPGPLTSGRSIVPRHSSFMDVRLGQGRRAACDERQAQMRGFQQNRVENEHENVCAGDIDVPRLVESSFWGQLRNLIFSIEPRSHIVHKDSDLPCLAETIPKAFSLTRLT